MEELKNEQISVDAQTAEAEVNKGEVKNEISLGKFKDVNALLNAYNSLESEFTKRCQKLKELEGMVDKVAETTPTVSVENPKDVAKGISDEDKETILKDYLKSIVDSGKNVVFLDNDGVMLKTEREKPKNIDEAGCLAENLFKN